MRTDQMSRQNGEGAGAVFGLNEGGEVIRTLLQGWRFHEGKHETSRWTALAEPIISSNTNFYVAEGRGTALSSIDDCNYLLTGARLPYTRTSEGGSTDSIKRPHLNNTPQNYISNAITQLY